jgi:hypothetical protein
MGLPWSIENIMGWRSRYERHAALGDPLQTVLFGWLLRF